MGCVWSKSDYHVQSTRGEVKPVPGYIDVAPSNGGSDLKKGGKSGGGKKKKKGFMRNFRRKPRPAARFATSAFGKGHDFPTVDENEDPNSVSHASLLPGVVRIGGLSYLFLL